MGPGAASAHAELVSSDPAANATLTEAPVELRLTFTEAVDAETVRVRLLDARNAAVEGLGQPSLDGPATTVTVALPDLAPGVYTVDYQVTSTVDGHVTSGIFAFLVDPTGAQPAPAVSTRTGAPGLTPDATAARWVALSGALALAGILIFWLASARPAIVRIGGAARAPWPAIVTAAAFTLGALVVYLMLAARPIVQAGQGGGGFPLDPAGPFGTTPFATAMRMAMLGALAAGLMGAAGWAMPATRERTWLLAALAAALVTLAGMSFAGHAAATGGMLNVAFDVVHLAGVAAWLGALVGVVLLAVRARRAVAAALRRHSRVALIAAPAVILTGIANSPLVLGDEARAVVASGYGNLLLTKVLLASAALGMGAANFFVVRRGVARVSLAVVGAELVVGALAVLAAAGLVTGQPPAGRAPVVTRSAIGAAHLYGTAGDVVVHAAVNLPTPGQQRYQVSVASAETGAYVSDVQRVFLVFDPPAASGLTSERVQLEPSPEAGLWGTTGSYTPVVGDWQLEVIVRRAGVLDESVAFPLAVVIPLPPQVVPPPDSGIGVPLPLAALWSVLPPGAAGWLVPLALLLAAVALFWAGRRRTGRLLAIARASVLLLAVAAGLGVGTRGLVRAANVAPAAAAGQPNPVAATAESVARGRSLFMANCAVCHGTSGQGDGPAAGDLVARPGRLDEEVRGLSDGEIAYRIAVGSAGTGMPAFAATLSESDRWDLVNYLRATWPR